jgi:hypothetical protein
LLLLACLHHHLWLLITIDSLGGHEHQTMPSLIWGYRFSTLRAKRLINQDVLRAAQLDADHVGQAELDDIRALQLGTDLLAVETPEDLIEVLKEARLPFPVTVSLKVPEFVL